MGIIGNLSSGICAISKNYLVLVGFGAIKISNSGAVEVGEVIDFEKEEELRVRHTVSENWKELGFRITDRVGF